MFKNAMSLLLGLVVISQLAVVALAQEESKPEAQEPLLKTTPYLQSITSTNVTVVWHTTRPAYSWVEYREANSTNAFKTAIASTYGLKDVGLVQSIRLTDLMPETSYTYRVNSREVKEIHPYKFVFGVDAVGEEYSFTTWPQKGSDFSFVMINDLHSKNDLHQKLLAATDARTAEFVCYNGDIVTDKDRGDDVLKDFLNVALSYSAEKPFFMLRGNHETRGAFSRSLHTFFPTPTGQYYYTFSYGDVYFVNLDCGEDKVDTSKEYGGLVDFDSYRTEQVAWLAKVVQSPEYKAARYRIFFCHIPPAAGGESGVTIDVLKPDNTVETVTSFGEPWHGDIEIRDKFLPFMLDNKADLLLCGHQHELFNCDYKRGSTTLPVFVNDNKKGVRVDVSPENLTLTLFADDGKVVLTKTIPAQKKRSSRQKLSAQGGTQ